MERAQTYVTRTTSLPLEPYVLTNYVNDIELTLELLGKVHSGKSAAEPL
jgi:hypothetical protein